MNNVEILQQGTNLLGILRFLFGIKLLTLALNINIKIIA